MHGLYILAVVFSWIIAAAWTLRVLVSFRNLPRVPNLLKPNPAPLDPPVPHPVSAPLITVIVPACNEAAAIEATLRSLLAQTLPLEILAVDDRSTDSTGALMDRIAAEPLPSGKFLSVIHIDSLPAGWMGKPHAMALAARQSATPWLLFTDADVLFQPATLERALLYARQSSADHLVLWPSLILKTPGERMVEAIFQSLLILMWNPWKIADPKATRDSVGMGAFNLIRSDVYRAAGGFESEPMEVVEDLRLGYQIKLRGFRQRLVLGRSLLQVHWAPGALGLLHNLTKNIFATFRFRSSHLLAACIGIGLLCFAPLAALFAPWPLRAAGILALAMVVGCYDLSSRYFNRIRPAYALTFPIGAALVLYAMLRSWIVTILRGGIVWRGTFYPLAELRRHAGPLR